ncbi:MAG: hypothetical protein DBX55_07335 [Verrucomicrobia bacterium]|nr:MAG: hypothetical protein DBX55_07335 [Verrucomicrobiota bacterium]
MNKSKATILSILLCMAVAAAAGFATYKALTRYYADFDNALFYALCAAGKNDPGFFERALPKFKSDSRRRDAEIVSAISNGGILISSDPAETAFFNLAGRILRGARIGEAELENTAKNVFGSKVRRMETGLRLAYLALSQRRFGLAESIASAFDCDLNRLQATAIAAGARLADLKKTAPHYAREFSLLDASLPKRKNPDLAKKASDRLRQLSDGTYYFNKYLLAQCLSNCGEYGKALNVLEDMYRTASNPPFNFAIHREKVRTFAASFFAANGDEARLKSVMDNAASPEETLKILSAVAPVCALVMGPDKAAEIISEYSSFGRRAEMMLAPPAPSLF